MPHQKQTDKKKVKTSQALQREISREKQARLKAEKALQAKDHELAVLKQALQKDQERFALAALGSNDGLWDWIIPEGKVYYSKRCKTILGLQDDELDPTIEAWINRIHPEDLQRVQKALIRYFKNPESHFQIDYRIYHTSGSYVWVLTRGIGVVGEDNQVVRMVGSQTDITLQKNNQHLLYQEAIRDKLTNLYNRKIFMEKLSQTLTNPRFKGVAVFFLDLDGFKYINDTLGHNIGDRLLRVIAKRLKECLREEDILARWGGDEFTLLVESDYNLQLVTNLANRMLALVNTPVILGDQEIFPQASMGIAFGEEDTLNADDLVRDADLAMYEAKNNKRGSFEIFHKDMRSKASHRLTLEVNLKRALEKKEIELFYQPIVSLTTLNPIGVEALMRWHHPKLGLVSPTDFIPVAEESSLINDLGQFAFIEACYRLQDLQKTLHDPHFAMHVNVSVRQLSDAAFLKIVEEGIKKASLTPGSLHLEITETLLISCDEQAHYALNKFKEMGIGLSIDDFGTGYSSLGILHEYPFSIIKIDKCFTSDLTLNPKARKMVAMITQLGQALDMKTIVEGIETEEELHLLQEGGCDYGQGYYFARPLPFDKLTAFLLSLPCFKKSFVS